MSRIAHWNYDYNGTTATAVKAEPCPDHIASWAYCMGW